MKYLKYAAKIIPIVGNAIDNYESNNGKFNWSSFGRSVLRLAGEVAVTVYTINQL